MKTPRERYHNDPAFKLLVDTMNAMIHRCEYTPSELRVAAILACVMYKEQRPHPRYIMNSEYEEALQLMRKWTDEEGING